MGIVSGTLGEQQRVALCARELSFTSVIGQVQALEDGAYLIRDTGGRKSVSRMTRILGLTDRPMWAHVGDRIQSWFDRHGRAVVIRSLDGDGR